MTLSERSMVSMIMEWIKTNIKNLKSSRSKVNQSLHHVKKICEKNPQNVARYAESASSNIIQKHPFETLRVQKKFFKTVDHT